MSHHRQGSHTALRIGLNWGFHSLSHKASGSQSQRSRVQGEAHQRMRENTEKVCSPHSRHMLSASLRTWHSGNWGHLLVLWTLSPASHRHCPGHREPLSDIHVCCSGNGSAREKRTVSNQAHTGHRQLADIKGGPSSQRSPEGRSICSIL